MLKFLRKDPVFKTWNRVESECHQFVRNTSPYLKSYLIDAMPINEFKLLSERNRVVAVTNSVILDNMIDLDLIECTSDSFYGVYYHDYPIDNFKATKDFNCFINRMDCTRQSWLYLLIRRDLFDRGYISFNLDISRIPYFKGLRPIEAFDQQFETHMKNFESEHLKIRSFLPYKNFVDTGDLSSIIFDSKFSIILETYFHNNNIMTYSEKTFRCLQIPRPWLLFAHKGAVNHLRQMGFDVLDQLIDHSYDQVENDIERQAKILDQAQLLVDIDLEQHRTLLVQATRNNQARMKEFSQRWQKDYQQTVAQALAKL